MLRINTHFDDAAKVVLNWRRRKILPVESVAIRTPIRIEINDERNVQFPLQLYRARIARRIVQPPIFQVGRHS